MLDWNRIQKISLTLVSYVLWPLVQLALMTRFVLKPVLDLAMGAGAAAGVTLLLLMHAGSMQAMASILNDGISPTSMLSGNTPQAALTTHYNRNFIENLKAKTVMLRMCTRESMPMKAGQVWRNFMIQPLPANTTQATEGTVGSGISVSINYQDYQLGQWADFLNIADKSFVTSISDDLMNYEREMAYRLALTVDDLVMAYFDYLRTLDSKTGNQDVTMGNYQLTKQQIEQAPFSLMGQNVLAMSGGYYYGKIHPFFGGDIMALDNSNNSIVDILKHTPEGMMKLEELPNGPDGDELGYFDMFGCRWMTSTNCTQTASYQGGSSTAVRTYLAGKDAIIAIKLDRPDRTEIDDGKYKNMKLWRGEYKPGSQADPAGLIGAGTSYNAILAFGVPPDTTSRARCFDAVPQTT
jgi:N4-gp56 family major capsid protein